MAAKKKQPKKRTAPAKGARFSAQKAARATKTRLKAGIITKQEAAEELSWIIRHSKARRPGAAVNAARTLGKWEGWEAPIKVEDKAKMELVAYLRTLPTPDLIKIAEALNGSDLFEVQELIAAAKPAAGDAGD